MGKNVKRLSRPSLQHALVARNRLHRSLFVRTDEEGRPRVHSTDPLLYRGGTFLLEGERHRSAVAFLDELLAAPDDRSIRDPGVYSVTSMRRGLQAIGRDNFTTYDWDVELKCTVRAKVRRFDWGLLQGLLEAR